MSLFTRYTSYVSSSLLDKNELNLAKEHLVSYFQLVPGKVTREDNYMLGYLYYSTGDYKSAIQYLTKVMTIKDSIYQSAAYHLGNAYLKTDQKSLHKRLFMMLIHLISIL